MATDEIFTDDIIEEPATGAGSAGDAGAAAGGDAGKGADAGATDAGASKAAAGADAGAAAAAAKTGDAGKGATPPAAAAPVADKSAAAPDPAKWVPVGVFVETKNELKRLGQELAALKNPPPAKPAAPDFAADPKGYVDHKVQDALAQLEGATKPVKEAAEQANATAAETRFQQALQTSEQSFVAQNPEYYDALNHLRGIRASELAMLNPDLTVPQIREIIGREELQLAANLMRSGRNPSQIAYEIAKARGWSPKAAAAAGAAAGGAADTGAAAAGNGASALPHVPGPKQLPPDQTLGTGAGSPNAGDDVDANQDPFDTAWSEMFGRKRA